MTGLETGGELVVVPGRSVWSVGETESSCCLGSIFTSYLLDSLADLTLLNLGLGKLEGKEMLLLMDLRSSEVRDLIFFSPLTTA